jgi:hypothetical protein
VGVRVSSGVSHTAASPGKRLQGNAAQECTVVVL